MNPRKITQGNNDYLPPLEPASRKFANFQGKIAFVPLCFGTKNAYPLSQRAFEPHLNPARSHAASKAN
jgi:hypothetical protein